MNKAIFTAIGLVIGAAAGSLVTWKVIEKKYQDFADEEIASVKKVYSERMADKNRELKAETFPVTVNTASPIMEFDTGKLKEIVDRYSSDEKPDYSAYSQAKQTENDSEESSTKPYIISPEEFGELGYTVCELTYFAGNEVLVDDNGEPVEYPERTVGDDFSSHFGEYEDDAVFVRNDRLMSDYQILLDPGAY